MQRENADLSKINQTKRVHKESTPKPGRKSTIDNATTKIHPGMSHERATMAPSDFSLLKNLPKRKHQEQLQSVQASLDVTQMIDSDCKDTELLYAEYLQNILTKVILEKKAQETKELIISQLATIAKEYDDNEEKLFKLKTRERDIINLSKVQNEVDLLLEDTCSSSEGEAVKSLHHILSQLYSLLQPLDMLRTNNIILPETPGKWEELNEILKSCSDTLKSIMDFIGNKSVSTQSINNKIKDFLGTLSNIENHKKKLEEDLCNLQALLMKTASLTLTQKDSNK